MFYREVTGVQCSAGDMCRGCERFPEPGQRPCQAAQQFLPALRRGLHLEVLYCPDYHPPLGKEKTT
jgi:hypothetical protein